MIRTLLLLIPAISYCQSMAPVIVSPPGTTKAAKLIPVELEASYWRVMLDSEKVEASKREIDKKKLELSNEILRICGKDMVPVIPPDYSKRLSCVSPPAKPEP